MGICFSKKSSSSSSSSSLVSSSPQLPPPQQSHNPFLKPKTTSPIPNQQTPVINTTTTTTTTKKEIFFIKQRNSHERRPEEDTNKDITPKSITPNAPITKSPSPSSPTNLSSSSSSGIVAPVVRTSSCTKEEVDAILIQCGRLSRSSSGTNIKPTSNSAGAEPTGSARKYSGSKRSYDFDHDNSAKCSTDEQEDNKYTSRTHRRTPSRERDLDYKRSGSNRHRSSSTSREEERKRNQSGGSTSRRLSRSPGRRSETPTSSSSAPDKSKVPAKMVSVPASTTGAIKRVSVKRTTASPRSQSPANVRENANAHHQPPSLSRNSSRKAEHSPYRRNPLAEIDDNINSGLRSEQINNPTATNNNSTSHKIQTTDQGIATKKNFHFQSQKSDERNGGIGKEKSAGKEQKNQTEHVFEAVKFHSSGVTVSPKAGDAGIENLKLPQATITRSRSLRRSRDLDIFNDNDALVNVPTSYASILLEDIQNFHHKNSNTTAFSLPPCVAKACSILDAVADLNSSTNSNISSGFSEERNSRHSNNNVCSSNVHLGTTRLEVVNKDPFVEETEVLVNDDLMEPSIHKYITVRRGMPDEMEQQESSGSNSIVGQQWFASSSWEPSSADSTDHWSAGRDEGIVDKEESSLPVFKKAGFLDGSRKSRSTLLTSAVTLSGKKRELDHHRQLSKVGAKTMSAPVAAAASM